MHPLDNPVWESLTSRHAWLARTRDGAARYAADVVPFAAVDTAHVDAGAALASLVEPGETVLLVGPDPHLPEGWSVREPVPIAQMVCAKPIATLPGREIVELDDSHAADMQALTALVYPHYFRPRSHVLGRYVGLFEGTTLVAMAGERMGFDSHQEISAVCTHPDHVGRGHAQRLVAELSNTCLAAGRVPFLHVSHDNARAKALYERIGYHHRTDILLWSVRRSTESGSDAA